MRKNIGKQLARLLQAAGLEFKTQQRQYLSKLRGREAKKSQLTPFGNAMDDEADLNEDESDIDPGFNALQLSQVEQAQKRLQTEEIKQLVQSINDLAQIMDDVA